jgi:hypothetical protein
MAIYIAKNIAIEYCRKCVGAMWFLDDQMHIL